MKKKFYEKKVIGEMMALLGDFQQESLVTETIKPRYLDHWNGVIEENMKKRKSEEFTAFILSINFYYDMFRNEISVEDKLEVRERILKNEHSGDNQRILSMLIYTYLMVNKMKMDGKISEEEFFLGLNEIHRSIFKDEDFLLFSEGFSDGSDKEEFMKTFKFLHDGKERMKNQFA